MSVLGLVFMIATMASTAERALPLGPFHALELAARATVQIEEAPVRGLTISGDPQLVRCVAAEVRDGVLVIGWSARDRAAPRPASVDGDVVVTARTRCSSHGDPKRLTVRVTTPTLDFVKLADQGAIHVAARRTPQFEVSIVERGAVSIDGLHADTTRLSIGGLGTISATGDLGKLTTSIAGSGTIDTRAATASAFDASIGGHGNVLATVNGPATGSLPGGGSIVVGGRPACAITNPGGGRIVCPAPSW